MTQSVVDKRGPFTIISDKVIMSDKWTKPVELAIYAVICKHAHNTTAKSNLRISTIAREAKCSEKVVSRSLRTLESAGFIRIIKNYRDDGGRTYNTYEILA